MYICIYVYIHIYIHACMSICIYICMYVYIYIGDDWGDGYLGLLFYPTISFNLRSSIMSSRNHVSHAADL